MSEFGFDIVKSSNLIFSHSYGDDGAEAFAATTEMTMEKFIGCFKKHWNWNLTPGDKSDVPPEYYRPQEYQFLQRILKGNVFVLPIEKLKTAGRFYKGRNQNTAYQAILSMLVEASRHGKSVFQNVLSYYKDRTDYLNWPTYEDCYYST